MRSGLFFKSIWLVGFQEFVMCYALPGYFVFVSSTDRPTARKVTLIAVQFFINLSYFYVCGV